MKILSLDSTAVVSTVAICENEKLLSEFTLNNGNTHSETLLPMIESALKMLKMRVSDIDLFACSAGPGSFTGVRIGVATIKGLAFDSEKRCVGVSTLDALAHNLIGYNGILCPVMNARRGQVYNALYTCQDGELTRLVPDRAISVYELEEELTKYADKDIYLSGDGYDIAVESFTKVKVKNTPIKERYQSAYSVAQCALKISNTGYELSGDCELVPTYLRPCQAERERLEKMKGNEQ